MSLGEERESGALWGETPLQPARREVPGALSGCMAALFREKLQIRFAKRGDVRFISHHDLMRLFERASRRAGLPLRMSEGFNPRPRISYPLSLAVGTEGREEVVEIQLADWMPPEEVHARLQAALPHGIRLARVAAVDPRRKAEVVGAAYRVTHPAISRLSDGDLQALLARSEVAAIRTRKGRRTTVNIRPYLDDLALVPPSEGGPALRVQVRVTPRGTARTEEVLTALGVPVPAPGREIAEDGPPTAAPHIVRERIRLAKQPEDRS